MQSATGWTPAALPLSPMGLLLFLLGIDFLKIWIWIWIQNFLSHCFFQEILINMKEFTCPPEIPLMRTRKSCLVIASLCKGEFLPPMHHHWHWQCIHRGVADSYSSALQSQGPDSHPLEPRHTDAQQCCPLGLTAISNSRGGQLAAAASLRLL